MKLKMLFLLLCWSTTLAAQTPPVSQPTQIGNYVIVHVLRKLSPDEARCVRSTTSHAVDRDSRATKGTQGTHGRCAGHSFRGAGGADIASGVEGPAVR